LGGAQIAVLQERARIARELHDSVSQTLYAISLGATRALTLLQQDGRPEVQRLIDDVLRLSGTAQSEVRALLVDIRSEPRTSGGLAAALTNLIEEVGTRNHLDIRLSAADAPDVPAATEHAVRMIVREALQNAVRHSAARQVEVALEHDAGRLVVLITDDGRGFDSALPGHGHFGLQSMRERATGLGGSLDLLSAAGLGTQLRVSIPIEVDTDG
jgi:NarL family two-component system sensor histidine kinase LiaS